MEKGKIIISKIEEIFEKEEDSFSTLTKTQNYNTSFLSPEKVNALIENNNQTTSIKKEKSCSKYFSLTKKNEKNKKQKLEKINHNIQQEETLFEEEVLQSLSQTSISKELSSDPILFDKFEEKEEGSFCSFSDNKDCLLSQKSSRGNNKKKKNYYVFKGIESISKQCSLIEYTSSSDLLNKLNYTLRNKGFPLTKGNLNGENQNIYSQTKNCCKCSKSHCLKQYCNCYKVNKRCVNCSCLSCQNFGVKMSSKSLKEKRCKCSNSQCIKKYCECFRNNKKCNSNSCSCQNCKNLY